MDLTNNSREGERASQIKRDDLKRDIKKSIMGGEDFVWLMYRLQTKPYPSPFHVHQSNDPSKLVFDVTVLFSCGTKELLMHNIIKW